MTFAQSGVPAASAITGLVEWIPVEMANDEAITIRVGDSIKLRCLATCGEDAVEIDVDGDGIVDRAGFQADAFVQRYDTAGTFIARAYDADGVEIGSADVTVAEVRLPKAVACQVGYTRRVTIQTGVHDPAGLVVTSNDPALMTVTRGEAADNHLRITLKARRRGTPVLQVRQGAADGPILAAIEVDEFLLETADLDNVVVNHQTSFAAGSITMRPFVPDLDVVATMFANASAFEAGNGKDLRTTTDAFTTRVDPATGETVADLAFGFLMPEDEDQFCFRVTFWQENKEGVPVGDKSKNGKRCRMDVPVIYFQYQDKGADQVQALNVLCHKKGEAHVDHPISVTPKAGKGPTIAKGTTLPCPDPVGKKDPPVVLPVNVTCKAKTPVEKYTVVIEGTPFQDKVIVYKASITVFSDQPVPGRRDPFRFGWGGVDVGHAFWKTDLSPADSVPPALQAYVGNAYGYYPSAAVAPNAPQVAGVLRDDNGHASDVKKTFDLTFDQAKAALQYTKGLDDTPGNYHLETNNCTDSAIDAAAAAGQAIPKTKGKWPKGVDAAGQPITASGCNPGDLGEDLRAMGP